MVAQQQNRASAVRGTALLPPPPQKKKEEGEIVNEDSRLQLRYFLTTVLP
jgi:hypothetical protein